MNEEEIKFVEDMKLREESTSATLQQERNLGSQKDMILQERNESLAVQQLDMSEELERMDNLLRGRIQKRNSKGEIVWVDPRNKTSICLSDEGVQFILNSMSFYLNKNTLLSNNDVETINHKMEDYADSLSDALFMRSQIYFRDPTPEEIKKCFNDKKEKKIKNEMMIAELQGRKIKSYKELEREYLDGIDIRKDLDGIKRHLKNEILRGYEHIMRVVQDSVHSTYNRSLFGQERKSIHSSIFTSEQIGKDNLNQEKSGVFGMFKK
jgi:hypothetical protein